MAPDIDPDSPVPRYHQLAEAIRSRITRGALTPGTVLPSLRQGAVTWGVNLHTVRHAYAELARLGLVRTEAPAGTVVLPRARAASSPSLTDADRFVAAVVREGRERHGLSANQLRAMISPDAAPAPPAAPPHVYAVEASEARAKDLARQLELAWRVRAEGWSLERPRGPREGIVVATYFHYNGLRKRWPERFPSIRFVAVRPDPKLAEHLAPFTKRDRRTKVLLVDGNRRSASSIVADLGATLPATRFRVKKRVTDDPADVLRETADKGWPVLFPLTAWDALGAAERSDPRAFQLRYLVDDADLAALGAEMGWEQQGRGPRAEGRGVLSAT